MVYIYDTLQHDNIHRVGRISNIYLCIYHKRIDVLILFKLASPKSFSKAFADPDALCSGHTALALAALEGRWEVAKLLLEHGCGSTGPSGDLAFRAAQRASKALEQAGARAEEAVM